MPTREDVLREKTFKGDTDDLSRRVFYTLTDAKVRSAGSGDLRLQAHRNSKAIALLVNHLRQRAILTDDDIDEILLDCVS